MEGDVEKWGSRHGGGGGGGGRGEEEEWGWM